jgi:hypothetical protein
MNHMQKFWGIKESKSRNMKSSRSGPNSKTFSGTGALSGFWAGSIFLSFGWSVSVSVSASRSKSMSKSGAESMGWSRRKKSLWEKCLN